jgi:hypothetical protein
LAEVARRERVLRNVCATRAAMIGRVKAPRIVALACSRRAGFRAGTSRALAGSARRGAASNAPMREPPLHFERLPDMRARLLIILSAAALALTSSLASAGLATNGHTLNGLITNGINPNGRDYNGSQLNGFITNGLTINGTQLGPIVNADARVDGIILGQAR